MAGNKRPRVGNAKTPQTRRLNAQLREDALTRLMLHSVMLRRNPGDLLSDLVDAHLRQFKVSANTSTKAPLSDSADPAVHATESEAVAA
jgi:hypothetical protein